MVNDSRIEVSSDSEDKVLDYTQEKRELIVNALLSQGVPDDPKYVRLVLDALDGMDRAALGKKRIKADSDALGQNALIGAAVTELLKGLRNEPKEISINEDFDESTLEFPVDIPEVEVIPGELSNNPDEVTFENILDEE